MASRPTATELAAQSSKTTIFQIVFGGLKSPWMDKKEAKRKMKARILTLGGSMAADLVLQKALPTNNGYGLRLFFLDLPKHLEPDAIKIFEGWCGPGGRVSVVNEEETAMQVERDQGLRYKRERGEEEVADVGTVSQILLQCAALQGAPVADDPEQALCQRKASLAITELLKGVHNEKLRQVKQHRRSAPEPSDKEDEEDDEQ